MELNGGRMHVYDQNIWDKGFVAVVVAARRKYPGGRIDQEEAFA